MRLHENKKLFTQAVSYTAEQMNIPEIFVEKDYWVTLALKQIFTSPLSKDVIFKGGTSLSKGFNILERFSEDIDLGLIHSSTTSANQLKKKFKMLSQIIGPDLPEIEVPGLTNKKGILRKTVHSYQKEFGQKHEQVLDAIVLETTSMGNPQPYVQKNIQSFITSTMQISGQHEIIAEYELEHFTVNVQDPTRTICEKIMSLVRFSYEPDPLLELKRKIRHVYDLHQLLEQDIYDEFIKSPGFQQMMVQTAKEDMLSFKNNNSWVAEHPSKAFVFDQLDSIENQLRSQYNGSFKNLVYGKLPKDTLIIDTLRKIKHRVSALEWDITHFKELSQSKKDLDEIKKIRERSSKIDREVDR